MSFGAPRLIPVERGAEMLGLASSTVYNLKGGTARLTRVRLGRSVRLIEQEVEALREKLVRDGQKGRLGV